VEKKISTRRGNCNSMKRLTGIPERKTIGITICSFPSNRINYKSSAKGYHHGCNGDEKCGKAND
jgi:hypothetical protein